MALDLQAIREALKAQLDEELARDINVYAYRPANPVPPYVAVISGDPYISYYETFASSAVGSLCDVQLELIIGQTADAISAQVFIDDLLSAGAGQTSSVIDALEADPTLGGVVATCIALRAGPIVFAEDGSATASVPLQIAIRRT